MFELIIGRLPRPDKVKKSSNGSSNGETDARKMMDDAAKDFINSLLFKPKF